MLMSSCPRTFGSFAEALLSGRRLIETIPPNWFTPTTMLEAEGWPDLTATSLADWRSSRRGDCDAGAADWVLVLALTRMAHPVCNPEGWRFVAHATGGIWSETKLLAVRKLGLTDLGHSLAQDVARHWAGSNVNARYAAMDQLVEYRSCLQNHGLDCNLHIQDLAEAFYPIDLDEIALERLAGEVPEDARNFLDHGAMTLALLSSNCTER